MKRSCSLLLMMNVSVAVLADTDSLIERAGDVLSIALPLTALTATYTLDDPQGRQQLLLSYGTALGLTYTGKYLIGKARPDGSDRLSFPSGHTSSAFSGASFLAQRYGWDVGVPAYLAASFVGYSRVHANRHDVWDVSAGAVLAMAVNHWLVTPRDDDLSVSLLPLEHGVQLSLAWRY